MYVCVSYVGHVICIYCVIYIQIYVHDSRAHAAFQVHALICVYLQLISRTIKSCVVYLFAATANNVRHMQIHRCT